MLLFVHVDPSGLCSPRACTLLLEMWISRVAFFLIDSCVNDSV